MNVRKCCDRARFPGGIRKARAIAKELGFVGTVKLTHYGHDADSKSEIEAGGILSRAYYSKPQGKRKDDPRSALIVLYINGKHKGVATKTGADAGTPREKCEIWLHELGHHLRYIRGRHLANNAHSANWFRDYYNTPEERSARRFANFRIKTYWPE